jgi:hypothetical protein
MKSCPARRKRLISTSDPGRRGDANIEKDRIPSKQRSGYRILAYWTALTRLYEKSSLNKNLGIVEKRMAGVQAIFHGSRLNGCTSMPEIAFMFNVLGWPTDL